jgi:hypothetical protein
LLLFLSIASPIINVAGSMISTGSIYLSPAHRVTNPTTSLALWTSLAQFSVTSLSSHQLINVAGSMDVIGSILCHQFVESPTHQCRWLYGHHWLNSLSPVRRVTNSFNVVGSMKEYNIIIIIIIICRKRSNIG